MGLRWRQGAYIYIYKRPGWRSGQSARLSPLRLRVRFSERTFSMLLEPSAPCTHVKRVSQHSAESRGFSPGAPVSSHREVDRVG